MTRATNPAIGDTLHGNSSRAVGGAFSSAASAHYGTRLGIPNRRSALPRSAHGANTARRRIGHYALVRFGYIGRGCACLAVFHLMSRMHHPLRRPDRPM